MVRSDRQRPLPPPQTLPHQRGQYTGGMAQEDVVPKPMVQLRRGRDILRELGKKPGRLVLKLAVMGRQEGPPVLGITSQVNRYWREATLPPTHLLDMVLIMLDRSTVPADLVLSLEAQVAYHSSVALEVMPVSGREFGIIAMTRRKQLTAVSFKAELEASIHYEPHHSMYYTAIDPSHE